MTSEIVLCGLKMKCLSIYINHIQSVPNIHNNCCSNISSKRKKTFVATISGVA